MTLTLSPEIEKALTAAAARKGTTPDQIVTEMVQEMVQEKFTLPVSEAESVSKEETTLAELFAGRTGLVDSEGRHNYSSHTGKAYTESLLKQQEQKLKSQEGQP